MNSKPSIQSGKPSHDSMEQSAGLYIRQSFAPNDRLAVVLANKRGGDVIQRIASAERIAAPDFQAWLRFQNAKGYEVYVSMNALSATATGRTKADVETIRHIYLDFDEHGTSAVEKLLERKDLPRPNHLISTSPDRWQVAWKVDGFAKENAEHLQQALAREAGADPAATDCSRVLRLPGFYNHKYGRPFAVGFQTLSKETYGREHFPNFPSEGRLHREPLNGHTGRRRDPSTVLSQSERDWAFAKRALARGDSEETVVAAIASHRRFEKHNPQYYAQLTVRKAAQDLSAEGAPAREGNDQPNR